MSKYGKVSAYLEQILIHSIFILNNGSTNYDLAEPTLVTQLAFFINL